MNKEEWKATFIATLKGLPIPNHNYAYYTYVKAINIGFDEMTDFKHGYNQKMQLPIRKFKIRITHTWNRKIPLTKVYTYNY